MQLSQPRLDPRLASPRPDSNRSPADHLANTARGVTVMKTNMQGTSGSWGKGEKRLHTRTYLTAMLTSRPPRARTAHQPHPHPSPSPSSTIPHPPSPSTAASRCGLPACARCDFRTTRWYGIDCIVYFSLLRALYDQGYGCYGGLHFGGVFFAVARGHSRERAPPVPMRSLALVPL